MRSKVLLGTRTYPIARSLSIALVDLWTLCCIANPLQDGCLSCIRSSDNEHSELDVWDWGVILLCGHIAKRL